MTEPEEVDDEDEGDDGASAPPEYEDEEDKEDEEEDEDDAESYEGEIAEDTAKGSGPAAAAKKAKGDIVPKENDLEEVEADDE